MKVEICTEGYGWMLNGQRGLLSRSKPTFLYCPWWWWRQSSANHSSLGHLLSLRFFQCGAPQAGPERTVEEERTCLFLWAYCRFLEVLMSVTALLSQQLFLSYQWSLNPMCKTYRNICITSTPLPQPEIQTSALAGWSPFFWDLPGKQICGSPPMGREMSPPID